MVRDIQAQQEVLLGQLRAEFERAQHEIEGLRVHVDTAERERDTSTQQLAAESLSKGPNIADADTWCPTDV
eukprot:4510096-Amphidinium_carterae.1